MKTKQITPIEQTKITITLDAHTDVLKMFFLAMDTIKPKPTKVAIAVEALREYLPKILGLSAEEIKILSSVNNASDPPVGVSLTPNSQLSDAERTYTAKLHSELAAQPQRQKRKKGKR